MKMLAVTFKVFKRYVSQKTSRFYAVDNLILNSYFHQGCNIKILAN